MSPSVAGAPDRGGLMLRMYLAWRLLRILAPLLLCGVLAIAVLGVRGVHTPSLGDRGQVARAVRQAERSLQPVVSETRRLFTQALTGKGRR